MVKKRYIHEDETSNNETTRNKGTTCGITNVQVARCVFLGLSRSNGCNKSRQFCRGWFSGMVSPIYSIFGLLTLHSNNVLGI